MRAYKSYLFKNKDPIIDETRTMIEDATGMKINSKGVLKSIEENGGPTVSCMRGWFFGEIKCPQNVTVEATGRALGYRRTWVKMKK
jgi:hypothetical protein